MAPRYVLFAQPVERVIRLVDQVNNTGRVGVTYECSGQFKLVENEIRECLRMALNMAKIIGIMRGRPERSGRRVTFLSGSKNLKEIKAPCSGLFVDSGLKPGAKVTKGALLGHIILDRDLKVREIFAPAGGFLKNYGAFRPNCDVALTAHRPYIRRGRIGENYIGIRRYRNDLTHGLTFGA